MGTGSSHGDRFRGSEPVPVALLSRTSFLWEPGDLSPWILQAQSQLQLQHRITVTWVDSGKLPDAVHPAAEGSAMNKDPVCSGGHIAPCFKIGTQRLYVFCPVLYITRSEDSKGRMRDQAHASLRAQHLQYILHTVIIKQVIPPLGSSLLPEPQCTSCLLQCIRQLQKIVKTGTQARAADVFPYQHRQLRAEIPECGSLFLPFIFPGARLFSGLSFFILPASSLRSQCKICRKTYFILPDPCTGMRPGLFYAADQVRQCIFDLGMPSGL